MTDDETFQRGFAICPYCGSVQRGLWEAFTELEGTIETECCDCDEPITIRRSVTFYYTTMKGAAK